MIEAMKQALEALENITDAIYVNSEQEANAVEKAFEAITSLRQAIEGLESQERNFCPRCGKRTNDIHTCTPPQRSESSGKPSAWVGLTNEELTDLFYNTNLGQQSAVSQAVALLKQKNT
jgi:anaerobic ribonucleoside-triphosphate reductase